MPRKLNHRRHENDEADRIFASIANASESYRFSKPYFEIFQLISTGVIGGLIGHAYKSSTLGMDLSHYPVMRIVIGVLCATASTYLYQSLINYCTRNAQLPNIKIGNRCLYDYLAEKNSDSRSAINNYRTAPVYINIQRVNVSNNNAGSLSRS